MDEDERAKLENIIFCLMEKADNLSPWDWKFVQDMDKLLLNDKELSQRQSEKLMEIWDKNG